MSAAISELSAARVRSHVPAGRSPSGTDQASNPFSDLLDNGAPEAATAAPSSGKPADDVSVETAQAKAKPADGTPAEGTPDHNAAQAKPSEGQNPALLEAMMALVMTAG